MATGIGILQVCVYLWFMSIIMTTMVRGTVRASGVKQNRGKYDKNNSIPCIIICIY